MNACGRGIDRRSGTRDRLLDMARSLHGSWDAQAANRGGANPSLRVPCMTIDEKCMAHARECVRLAGLTDDQGVRNQLIALARDWIIAARKEEDDDDSKVLVFPSAVERSRRHGLRMSLRHAGPR